MPPIEKFSPKEVDYYDELIPAVDKVLGRKGIIRVNSGEDEQTSEQYIVYSLGTTEEEAMAVVLIGNDASSNDRINALDKDARPHRLIAPEEIIRDVRAELDSIRSNPRQK